ncbi:MAG: DNA repair protein RecN [Thermodesulfovibrionia bacterium]|nr:DNA repair protein RecN [Thermodesulfovibrionia bacterium]
MLRELHIKNLAIIDDASANFEKGLNVLTGETGAGKSIIIDALCLALGERASTEVIRSGEKEAVVEAFFDIPPKLLNSSSRRFLQDLGINIEDGIILKRILSAQGKNRAYINDSIVNVQTLSEISKGIIDVHGQYEYQSLLSPDNQLDMLDAYGGLLIERQEFTAIYETQTSLKQQIAELMQKEKERAQRLDILGFQVNEIETADLKIGEEEELSEEVKILSSASLLTELANQAYESLYSSDSACLTNLSKILNSLKEISNIDVRAADAVKSAEEAIPLLEETAYFLRDYKDSLNFNPERLEEIQTRLELIKGLKKKYGGNIQEVLDYREKGLRELDELQHSEEKLETLNAELKKLKNILTEKAQHLSKQRKAVAKKIEQQVISELSSLSMPDTRFSIQITQEAGDETADDFKANSKGIDKIEYLISPNIGEELKPLSKIASGGELSRVMLALKGILAKGDKIPVLIFDEIDAGIGGRAAETVGQKLKSLSASHQIICITHLPQIASYADTHLKIEKKIKAKRTTVEVRKIEKDERTVEIARMLSGDSSEVSIKHAKEMIKSKMERV